MPTVPNPTNYHVYGNSGTGGPIDYTTPIASVSALTWTSPALSPGTHWAFGVRAFDSSTLKEERNVDCRVDVVLDAGGNDVTAVPGPPGGLAAAATASGGAEITWDFSPVPGDPPPTQFRVWLTAGGPVNYAAAPAATVPYVAGQIHYSAPLAGLADGTSYSVGVRAHNATGDDGNTLRATVIGRTTGPGPADALAIRTAPRWSP